MRAVLNRCLIEWDRYFYPKLQDKDPKQCFPPGFTVELPGKLLENTNVRDTPRVMDSGDLVIESWLKFVLKVRQVRTIDPGERS